MKETASLEAYNLPDLRNSPHFYAHNLFTVLTRSRHLFIFLSQINSLHVLPSDFLKSTLILSSHLFVTLQVVSYPAKPYIYIYIYIYVISKCQIVTVLTLCCDYCQLLHGELCRSSLNQHSYIDHYFGEQLVSEFVGYLQFYKRNDYCWCNLGRTKFFLY
jgi:hypothetical protein